MSIAIILAFLERVCYTYERMMNTINYNLKNNKEGIIKAIKTILEPIANTMSPQGSSVMFRGSNGKPIMSNDGATIAKVIQPESELERLIIDAIIEASEQTNKLEGDATSTTVLLTGTILLDYISKSDKISQFEYIKNLKSVRDSIVEQLEKKKLTDDKIIKQVAFTSSNNDREIADITLEVVEAIGDYGVIGYDTKNPVPGFKYNKGYIIQEAIPHPIFLENKPSIKYTDVAIFVTEMKLFHQEHVATILQAAKDLGYKQIILVAQDFQAKIPGQLEVIQQKEDEIRIIPIAVDDKDILYDIAAYVGGSVYTNAMGTPTEDKIKRYIGTASEIEANQQFALIKDNKGGEKLNKRIELVKNTLEEKGDDPLVKGRLSSLTSGVVTLSPGGDTEQERMERMMRFDDSIRATQRAMVLGALPGGGVTMKDIAIDILGERWSQVGTEDLLYKDLIYLICMANFFQIMTNSGITNEDREYKQGDGYNALTNEWGDMVEMGVIDSFPAVKQSLLSSISTSIQLISVMNNAIIVEED